MKTNSGIQFPENLFKAIDSVHREATQCYGEIPGEAMLLISPIRDKIKQQNEARAAQEKSKAKNVI